jgi:hypothetical protein
MTQLKYYEYSVVIRCKEDHLILADIHLLPSALLVPSPDHCRHLSADQRPHYSNQKHVLFLLSFETLFWNPSRANF